MHTLRAHQHAGPSCSRHAPARQRQNHPTLTRSLSSSSDSAPSATPSSSQHPLRRLIMLRHADSTNNPAVRDHDRTISLRGEREAAGIARKLKALGLIPEVILASNAKRTRQTLERMSDELPELEDADVHFLGSLYTAAALDGHTRGHLQDKLCELVSEEQQCVLCIGHNKGWEEASSSFSRQEVRLETGCAALLQQRAATWAEVLRDGVEWELVTVVSPA